jgi:murein endopeptidase
MLLGSWSAPWGARYGAALFVGALAFVFGGRASGARGEDPAAPVATARAVERQNVAPEAPVPLGPVLVETVTIRPSPHPLDGLTSGELDKAALELARGSSKLGSSSLGPVAVGRPNRGRLFNAVALLPSEGLSVMAQDGHNFGTEETVQSLREAAAEVRRAYPGGADLLVGDLSSARGGYLRPHRSHQLGLDADLGYFYRAPGKWYTKANAANLDRERTWAFMKVLIARGNVEYIFVDRAVQALLREHALAAGEDPLWLETLFETPRRKDTLFRHVRGHATHFHVRFLDPRAEESGRRLRARLRRAGKI